MRVSQAERYPRYRAPQNDGEILCRPSWQQLPAILERQHSDSNSASLEIGGRSLAALQAETRRAALKAALDYTRSYADVELQPSAAMPIVATGHQPGFVHPGVWLKNFAAAKLATQAGGVAVSAIIDSDLCRTHSLQVPTGSVDAPRIENVPFDQPMAQVPFEERTVVDQDMWSTFGERATQAIAPLLADPMLRDWWPEVLRTPEGPNLGQALARARHRLELDWQSTTLELPQSQLCQTEPFRRFAAHLLLNALEFRNAYNSALNEYRREHRLRNAAQPVPDLHLLDDWVEVPFWIWSSADPSRRALYVRRDSQQLQFADHADLSISLPADVDSIVTGLAELEHNGTKLRTRALLTTMFARLVLSDVFVHGIGGAKYDQVTDHICELFFGFRPPPFVTLTGTLRLPIAHPQASFEKPREIRQLLRRLRYQPEKVISAHEIDDSRQAEYEELVAQKCHWITTPKTHESCAERHVGIDSTNRALQRFTAHRVKQLEQELQALQKQLRNNRVLDSREFSFCLFPREKIRDFMLDFHTPMA